MDHLPISEYSFIPQGQASPAQLVQALVTAREALGPYYPTLTWPQWHQAFDFIQPDLEIKESRVEVSSEGLTLLARHFEAHYSSSGLASQSPPELLADSEPEGALSTQLPSNPSFGIKRTYQIRPDIAEGLERVSFWQRKQKADIVNSALRQFLAEYPESQVPIPGTEV